MKRLPNPCTCSRLHIWTDGQPFHGTPPARWDGHATVVIDTEDGSLLGPGRLLTYKDVGDKTSNECEYAALILALEWAIHGDYAACHIIIDSDLIIGHLNDWRCKQDLRPYRDQVRDLIEQSGAKVSWQGRDYNKAGWHNAGVLLARAKEKRQRDKERGVQRKTKRKVEQVAEGHKRWQYQVRYEDV